MVTLKKKTDERKYVNVWVDGSTWPKNPGKYGGWGAVFIFVGDGKRAELHLSKRMNGGNVTNNQAETEAIIRALEALKEPCHVSIHTDSMYVIKCFKKVSNGGMPNANKEYWYRMKNIINNTKHDIKLIKVEGHSGNEQNELAHTLAYNASSNNREVEERFIDR